MTNVNLLNIIFGLGLDEKEHNLGVSPRAVKSDDTNSNKRNSDKRFTKSKDKRRIEEDDLLF